MSKEITTKQSTEVLDYMCLSTDGGGKAAAILKENLGSGGIDQSELTRIKIPAGGALNWAVPTVDGEQSQKAIEGIIIHFADVRAYWEGTFTGGNAPPTCASSDGTIGAGNPGGVCRSCPLNEFGTGKDGQGKPNNSKACREGRLLFMLRESDVIPIVIALSTMSIKPCKKYFLMLASAGVPYYGAVTRLELTGAQNAGGIKYAQATFNSSRRLTDEEIARVQTTVKTMGSVFAKETVLDHEEANGTV